MTLPDYIIIGAQKSATTFIHETLRRHPGIDAKPGEITVFRDLSGNEDKIPDYFDNLFPKRNPGRIVGIKFPEYLADESAAVSIKRVLPDVKLIAVLRNPIERIVSAYYHYVSSGLAPLLDMNEGLPEVIQGKHYSQYPKAVDLVEYGYYSKHLNFYLDHFKRSQILILLYEDIRTDAVQSIRTTLNFLQVDASAPITFPKRRLGKTVSSLERLRFHRWRNPILYGFDYEKKRVIIKTDHKFMRETLARATNLFDKIILGTLLENKKPQLDPALAELLLDLYKEDICSLETLLNRDLSAWKSIRKA